MVVGNVVGAGVVTPAEQEDSLNLMSSRAMSLRKSAPRTPSKMT